MPPEKKQKKGQLRDTFILLFILIACIPILALGTVSLISINHSHTKNISELEHQTLRTAEKITDTFFENIIDTLSTNFDTLNEKTLTEASSSWQEIYAEKFVQDNKAILEVSFINLQGKEVAKYSKINTSTNLLYLSELDLFKKALEGNVAISNVHRTMSGQSVTILVPSRVNGTIFNVVMAEVSLSPLSTALEKIKLGTTGYILLFDKLGTGVGSEYEQGNHYVNIATWQRITKVIAGESFDGTSLFDRYESPLTSMPVVGSALRTAYTGWPLLIEWPLTEADTLVENFRKIILLTIFISIVVVLLIASFVANLLIKPIRALQEAAHQIEKGNFEQEVSITTNNELQELGESFNTMSSGLKHLEELKNEFVYVAAHELRAPVTAIKGYLELIFDGDAGALSPEMEKLLSPVKRSNERLVNLVNDLLQVAKSEAGKLEIAVSPCNIGPEIEAILDEIKPLAKKRNMTVTYQEETNLPHVLVNTGNFKEIIMNFASNAVKYGNDNGTIIVSHTLNDTTVATSIADNGRGMSEEDQKHLFEKFFRASDVRKTSIEGTGLGLFITKELVEKMGGTLTVTSELGVGTTFTVTFKRVQ